MVDVKIDIRLLTNTPELATQEIEIGQFFAGNNKILTWTAVSTLDQMASEYGLRGRKVYYKNSQGIYAYALIINWGVSSDPNFPTYIQVSNWFGSTPTATQGYSFKIYVVKPDANRYISPAPVESYNASTDLIEQNLKLIQQVERGEKFNLESSYGSATFFGSDELKAFMETYWKRVIDVDWSRGVFEQYHLMFELEIWRNGSREFFGLSKIEDVTYDEINNIYTFNIYDYLPFMLESIGTSKAPSATPSVSYGEYFTVSQYLKENLQAFSNEDPEVVLWDGDTEVMNYKDYLSYYEPYFGQAATGYRSVSEELTLGEFLIEMQKHYGAYLFYNMQTRSIAFYNRNTTVGELRIDDLIIEDTFERSYGEPGYVGLLVNATERELAWTWTGFAATSVDANGTFRGVKVVSEEEATNLVNYLDLRQRFPGQGFEWFVFDVKTPAERVAMYKELFYQTKLYTCVIKSLDVQLLNKILYQESQFTVARIEKDYLLGRSKLEIIKLET